MSYVDNIPPGELDEYEIVEDWSKYIDKVHRDHEQKSDATRPLAVLNLDRMIFFSDVALIGDYSKTNIRIEYCYFKRGLSFINSTFEQQVSISNCFIDGDLSAGMNCRFQDGFNIFSTKAKSFSILNAAFHNCIWHVGDCSQVSFIEVKCNEIIFYPWPDSIKRISLNCTNSSGNIRIIDNNSTLIDTIEISNSSNDLFLELQNLNVNNFILDNYRNDKGLRVSGLKPLVNANRFVIGDSYLGKAEFYDIDFTKYQQVSFYNSFLADSIFVNIDFPKNIDLFKDNPKEEEVKFYDKILSLENRTKKVKRLKYDSQIRAYYARKREILRQIKFALSKQGDTINEQKFHALEVRAFDRSLTWKNNGWTKLIIKASSWTSDFGQRVDRPLISLLIGHWFFFFVLLVCGRIDGVSLALSNPDPKAFRIAFHEFFRLINPLRRADDTFAGLLIIIDLLMRIWGSYMIYNIIRATRRFIK